MDQFKGPVSAAPDATEHLICSDRSTEMMGFPLWLVKRLKEAGEQSDG